MSRLPRLAPGAGVKDIREYLNLLASAIDAGGFQNIAGTVTDAGVTGQGMTQNFPPTPGSTNPQPGSSGAPNTPSGLILSYGIDHYHQTHDGYIVISWTPNPVSDNISRYDIYWRKGSDTNLHQLTVGGDVTSARINSVIPGLSYVFAIQAHDTSGRASNFSPEQAITISLDVDPPAVPTGLAATSTGTGVYLVWTEVGSEGISNDLKQYQIAVSLDGGATYPNTYTIGPGNSYHYVPTTANQGTVFFKIASVDWTGNVSAYSSAVSAAVGTILGPVTINPGGLTVSTGNIVASAGEVITQGSGAGLQFQDRSGSAGWQWYATSNIARLYNGTTDVMSVTTGGLATIANGLTITAGTLNMTGGPIVAGASAPLNFLDLSNITGSPQIRGGTTGFGIANVANSAFNFLTDDSGNITLRNALNIPPSAGGTVATTSYGSVPVKIAEHVLGGTAASVTFSSIPGAFRHLVLEFQARSDQATTAQECGIQFNSDATAGHYTWERLTANGASVVGFDGGTTAGSIAHIYISGSSDVANAAGAFRVWIPNYSGTTFIKSLRADGSVYASASFPTASLTTVEAVTGFWNSTAAITTVTIFPAVGNFVAGSLFTLYGIP